MMDIIVEHIIVWVISKKLRVEYNIVLLVYYRAILKYQNNINKKNIKRKGKKRLINSSIELHQ